MSSSRTLPLAILSYYLSSQEIINRFAGDAVLGADAFGVEGAVVDEGLDVGGGDLEVGGGLIEGHDGGGGLGWRGGLGRCGRVGRVGRGGAGLCCALLGVHGVGDHAGHAGAEPDSGAEPEAFAGAAGAARLLGGVAQGRGRF